MQLSLPPNCSSKPFTFFHHTTFLLFFSILSTVSTMKNSPLPHNYYFAFILLCLIVLPSFVHAEANCTCEPEDEGGNDKTEAKRYKIVAIIAILIASTIGVCIPLLGKTFPALSPEKAIFFFIKAFADGVILSTGFIHVLPDAFNKLTSPCLKGHPWGDFPFAGFVTMLSAIGALMIDCSVTAYFRKLQFDMNEQDGVVNEEGVAVHDGQVHGHASSGDKDELLRQRVISQVLEFGIVVHSVIIGISLGASETLKTIRPLVAALTFHQFFEGMGLGGCISQAKFKIMSIMIMAFFFSLTTPIGIAIGMRITNIYDEDSSTALIVEGVLNAASAGILIYMSLVDLLAPDFMNPRIQTNGKLQIGANVSLLLGTGYMSLLAKWA